MELLAVPEPFLEVVCVSQNGVQDDAVNLAFDMLLIKENEGRFADGASMVIDNDWKAGR